MFASRLLSLAALFCLCHASTSYRPGSPAGRKPVGLKWPGKSNPRPTAESSKQSLQSSPPITTRYATVALPDEAPDGLDGVKPTFMQNVKKYFAGKDGMTSSQRMRKMGLDVILSYGFVQNMSYTVTISLAWYLFSAQTGLSPLAPGQWKPFLAINAGFMVFQNLIRPVHVALAVVVSPYFDKIVDGFQNRFGFSRRVSITVTALLANLVGTLALMGAGICFAATCAGVPVFPPKF